MFTKPKGVLTSALALCLFTVPISCTQVPQDGKASSQRAITGTEVGETSSTSEIASGDAGVVETLSAHVKVKAGSFKSLVTVSLEEVSTPTAAKSFTTLGKAQQLKITDAAGNKVRDITSSVEISFKDISASGKDPWILIIEDDGTKGLVKNPTVSGDSLAFKISSTNFIAVPIIALSSTPSDITFTVDEDGKKIPIETTTTTTATGTTTTTTSTSTTTTTRTPTPTPISPGITVTSSSLTTTEAGGTVTFTVKLDTAPTANVTIALSSSDTTEGTVSPATLTFTSSNYGTSQTVTVTGVDDATTDGNISYTVVIAAAVSTDTNYSGLNPTDLTLSNTDDDIPGFTLTSIYGNTTEAGGTATFTMKLSLQPSADVTVGITSSDTTEGTVSPSSLTFTSVNWNTYQTVTVTGVDDYLDDADISYSIVTAAASSSDTAYNGLNPSDVAVVTTDDDTYGFTIGAVSGNTTEAGGTATFTVKLSSQPTASVTVGLSSSNTAEGTVSPASLTFSTVNWNTNQTVTVTGVDDNVVDGNQSFSIVTAAATSSDSQYNGYNHADVSVTNTDNDTVGFTISAISGPTTEAGGTATFTVKLGSLPSANVTIGLSSSDTTEGTVSPSSLTFTTANWNTNQTVTVTGVDDADVDGSVSYSIVTAASSSSDSAYNNINPADVSVSNTDNEASTPIWTKFASSGPNACAIDSSSKLSCWGYGSMGTIGDGTTNSKGPVRAGNSTWEWKAVALAGSTYEVYACAIRQSAVGSEDGTLYCWGSNSVGQLATGSTDYNDHSSPIQIGSGNTWAKLGLAAYFGCAIKTDGTLWCWGYNSSGGLGDGTTTNSYTPVQESSASTTWSQAAGGESHVCAIKSNGTLWCWGYNGYGQLGIGTADGSAHSNPAQVGSDTDWAQVDAGMYHTCAVKTTGTMWCWGSNGSYYSLGDGTTTARYTPVQVLTSGNGDTDWSQVAVGVRYTCATKTTGTLWCWGSNSGYQMGTGNFTTVTTPTQTISGTTWSAIATGGFEWMGNPVGTNCARKTDGTSWCWGWNSVYQVGDGSYYYVPTPVQITLP